MKKVIAVLLAVVMAFSFVTLTAAAEETGKTYTLKDMPRIAQASPEGEVAILQAGDVIEIGALTATKKTLNVYYYPDAAAISASTSGSWGALPVPSASVKSRSPISSLGQVNSASKGMLFPLRRSKAAQKVVSLQIFPSTGSVSTVLKYMTCAPDAAGSVS